METDEKNEIGVVVECYNHDSIHCVLTVRSQDEKMFHFFYIPAIPQIDFGDIIQMNFSDDKWSVRRGNSKLTFKINPLVFPKSLLWELITERMD